MIRWEKQEGGSWRGFSGELAIASVLRASAGGTPKWRWEVSAVEPPKGARSAGHRATALAARRAADDYWTRWLEVAALKPDVERLALLSET